MEDNAPKAADRGMLLSRLAASAQWERLLEVAHEALAEDPENPQAHRYAGQALVNLGRCREAEKHLVPVLAQKPTDDFAHRMMSIILFDLSTVEWLETARNYASYANRAGLYDELVAYFEAT